LSADTRFDRIELSNLAQGVCRQGRSGGLGYVVELAPRVAPERGENNTFIVCQLIEAGVTGDVHNAFEGCQMRDRAYGLAIRLKQIGCSRRLASSPRPLLSGVDSERSSLGATSVPWLAGYPLFLFFDARNVAVDIF
jgi:hypothetical protein